MAVVSGLGRTVGLFGVCFFLIGYVHASSLMYMISLFCFLALGGSALLARLSLRDLKCERSATGTTVFSGDPLEGKLRLVETKSRWRLLEVFDQHLNRVNGHVTRRRMMLLTDGGAVAYVAGVRQPLQAEGKSQRVMEVRDMMRFARRGHYRLGPLVLQAHDPLGLCRVSRTLPAQLDVIVYPRPLPIPQLVLGGGLGRQNTEVRPIGQAGESAEFHGIRPYVQGDDLRRVHWKATAHTGKLAIKEFEYRYSGAVQVVLDLQHGVHVGERDYSTLETAITLTASVLNHVLSAGNQAGMLATGAVLLRLPQESGQRQLHRALEALALAADDGTLPITQVLAGGATQFSRRCTTIVITPTVDTGIIGPLLALRGRMAQVLLVALDRSSFFEAEQEQRKPRGGLLARSPLELTGLRPLPAARHGLPSHDEHLTLVRAAAAAGIEVYPIGANIPLHHALQEIRMRI